MLVIFQPHLFSRTKQFHKDFAKSLFDADIILITEIFASREKLDPSISSKRISEHLKELNHENVFDITTESLVEDIKRHYKEGDIILTIGAGNIWRYADILTEKMK